MSLRAGQIVKMPDRTLWRVNYVNECRALIMPLVHGGALSISPDSPLEVVTDLERAQAELELEAAERELWELRSAAVERERNEEDLVAAEAELVALRSVATPVAVGGWQIGPVPAPAFKEGSLAAGVLACIRITPGFDTKTYVDIVKANGNVAACISRFNQAGYIHKETV